MKKLITPIAITALLVIIACHSAFTQDCAKVKGKCEGNCGTWYFRSNLNPMVAGQPYCKKINLREEHGKPEFDCACYLEHSSTNCLSIDHKLCDGTCPPVYSSIEDAMTGNNPIPGKCDVTIRTGPTESCACSYTKL